MVQLKHTIKSFVTFSFLLAGSSLGLNVIAQETTSQTEGDEQRPLEEIVVTASKRGEQTMRSLSMSIQAFTGEDLERRNVFEFKDYARSISGLSFQDQGPGDKKIILRGTASRGAATTAVYFDDVVISANNRQDGGGRQADLRLVDMERIEVLKGPQGTLYGASSMTGTVRMITNKPDPSGFAGSLNAGLGTTRSADGENYNVDGMLNIPLVDDKLALRLVGYFGEKGGYIDDTLNYGIGQFAVDGTNEETIAGGRAALRWEVTDDITVDTMWVHQELENDGPAWYQPRFGDFVQRNYQVTPWDEDMDIYNLAVEWDTNHGTISANTSYMDREIIYGFPATRVLCSIFTGAGNPPCFAAGPDPTALQFNGVLEQPQDRSIVSGELRYASAWEGPFQLIAGAFYQEEEKHFRSIVRFADVDGRRLPLSNPDNMQVNRVVDTTIEQKAVFGELSYSVTEKLTATAGLRLFDFEIDEVGQNLASVGRPVPDPAVPSNSDESDTIFKFNLAYDLNPDVMTYATFAEGFRSGGTNEPDFATGQTFPPFGSDTVDSYEAGVKGVFFDNALQLDAAAYYMDWEDIQERRLAQAEAGNFLIIDNVGTAEIQGLEVGAVWQPPQMPNFTLGGNLTLMEAELAEDAPEAGAAFPGQAGDRIPDVAEETANVYVEYVFPVFEGWESIARLDYAFVGDSVTTFRPDDPRRREQGDYSLVDFRLTFEDYSGRYRIGVFVENALDEEAALTNFVDASRRRPDQVTPLRPRTFGVDFGYKF